MSTYGYIRVSSNDQNIARQFIAMREYDIEKSKIFVNKQSGKDFERPHYKRLMNKLRSNDLLCILRIDRLGGNYEKIQNQWRIITKEKKVDICVIDMPLLDTRLHKDLMGTFIADLVLQILSSMAQSQRENIKKRQTEGISAAQARGVHMGRPAKRAPEDFETILHQWENKQISIDNATALCGGVSEATFYRWLRKHRLSEHDH